MSILNLNARLKVGTRVAGGFSAVLILLVIVAVTGYFGLTQSRTGFGQYATVAQNASRVLQIDSQFAQLRRNATLFAENGSAEARTNVRNFHRTITELANAAIPRFLSDERRAMARTVLSEIGQYTTNFEQIVQKRTERERAVNEGMNPIGARARTMLSELIEREIAERDFEAAAYLGIAQERFMLARVNALRFLEAPTPQNLEATLQQIGEIAPALERARAAIEAADAQAMVRAIADQVSQYGAAVRAAAAAVTEVDRLVTQVNAQLAAQINQKIDALTDAQGQAMAATFEASGASIDSAITLGMVATAIALGLGVVLAWLIGRGIAGPVRKMTGAMTTLADGNLDVEIPARDNSDEIGAMAKAVQVFKDNAIKVRAMQAEQEELKQRAEAEKKAALNKMADEFEASVGGVVKAVAAASTELQSAATSMSSTAEETSRQSTAVAAASEQASTNVTTVATATEELSSSIGEITRQVAQSAQIASKAVEESNRTTAVVKGLAEGATKIGNVVKLINDIAGQTNLLALNATIEAARAGEAGKGFAVVAAEVKNLATQTAKATEEIAAQIGMIQASTTDSVSAIDGIGGTIRQINEIATTIASAVEEQGAATQEIARNVQQASAGTHEVSTNISGVTQAATETGSAAAQVQASAGELSQQAEMLRQQVDRFLATIRAA